MLKGSFKKDYTFQTVVTAEILQGIDKYLQDRSKCVEYKFETVNGTTRKTNTIDDIISYDNTSDGKIERISMKAMRVDEYITRDFIVIQFFNRDNRKQSVSLEIEEASSDEIIAISREIGDKIERIKAPYSWIYNIGLQLFLICSFSSVLTLLLSYYVTPIDKEDNTSQWIIRISYLFSTMFLGWICLMRFIKWAYPETCFSIGVQKNIFEKRKRYRRTVFTAISTVLLGLIVHVITKSI